MVERRRVRDAVLDRRAWGVVVASIVVVGVVGACAIVASGGYDSTASWIAAVAFWMVALGASLKCGDVMGARALRRVEAWVASLPFETRGFTEVLRGSGSFAALRVEVDFRDDAKIPDRPLVEGLFRRVGASVSICDDGSIVAQSPKNGPTSTSSAPLYR